MPSPSDQGGRPVTPCPKCQAADVEAVGLSSNFVYLGCMACAYLFVIEDRRSGVRPEQQSRIFSQMASPPCPACTRNEAIYLGERSRFSYYLCPCGHGWGVHKEKPEVIYNVTPLPEKPDAAPEQ